MEKLIAITFVNWIHSNTSTIQSNITEHNGCWYFTTNEKTNGRVKSTSELFDIFLKNT